ncbi:MAG: ATP-dependent DNA helicase RecG [Parcubacteria group bacterium Gr01-1014_66]|nr:MAG: ATP-dependent DNA helicase RecG [Parcubacteria group bacterium Gr01-1014_66]
MAFLIPPSAPLSSVPRVHKNILAPLRRLGIYTVRDLLFHIPMRYDDFSNQRQIHELTAGETATTQGIITRINVGRTAKKHMSLLEVNLEDPTGRVSLVWFQKPFLARTLKKGDQLRVSGKIAEWKGRPCFQNPSHERIPARLRSDDISHSIHTSGLIPIYPETEGITSRWIRFLLSSFLPASALLDDPLPEHIRTAHNFPSLADALSSVHFPKILYDAERARSRLIFEKLLLIQLRALKERSRLKQHKAPAIPTDISRMKSFASSLPFALTNAQRKAIWEILRDMAQPKPMNRLLEGDVGSGKTVVAAAAILAASAAGYQTALMAPTEILATQHYATIQKVLAPFDVSIAFLTGGKKEIPADATLFIGTHALIQDTIHFDNLGLVIIDEQHRFGVEQRAALLQRETKNIRGEMKPLNKIGIPHFLSMSATPIPRTIALTIYSDLDLSILDELPKGRTPVITKIIAPVERAQIYAFIREEIRRGRQAYVVCPKIEVGEEKLEMGQQTLLRAELKAVTHEYEKLKKEIFPDFAIGMLHGKMPSKKPKKTRADAPRSKEEIMQDFAQRKLDILVATSVIEVGVDVPNATIMLIEGAERFGLAQLHQFRGRVGRGSKQSYCFLFPSEDNGGSVRLRTLVESNNGFELAEKDLALRGPGDLFGTAQWGVPNPVLHALVSNHELVSSVRHDAIELIKQSPDLSAFPLLQHTLLQMEKTIHLE